MENFKAKDRKAIVDYISNTGGDVKVADIIQNSGAERLRVYPILQELILEKQVIVIKNEEMGAPVVIRLFNNNQ